MVGLVLSSEPAMILKRLKQETSADHAAIELLIDLPRRLCSPSEYRRLLERFLGFYTPIEALLAARPEWGSYDLAIHHRLKAARIASDLGVLGLSPDEVAALPHCHDLPVLDTFPRALGAMYVLEGATLGGQIIARQLREALGCSAEHGGAFFSSYGDQVGAMWRSFRALLAVVAVDQATEDDMVRAANATFQAFSNWLARGASAYEHRSNLRAPGSEQL